VAQDGETAFVGRVQRPAEIVEQRFLGPFFLDVVEVGPFLGLGLLDEGEEDGGIEPPLGIKGLSITLGISGGGEQVMLNGGFKSGFRMSSRHQTASLVRCDALSEVRCTYCSQTLR
jgi:hypothetical protein